MKLICPFCAAGRPTTLRKVESGNPLYCPSCHRDINLSASKLKNRGEKQ